MILLVTDVFVKLVLKIPNIFFLIAHFMQGTELHLLAQFTESAGQEITEIIPLDTMSGSYEFLPDIF